MMRVGTLLSMTFLCCSVMGSQEKSPERLVRANVLTSERDPAYKSNYPSKYVTSEVIDGFFSELQTVKFTCSFRLTQNNVQRLYWLQFEVRGIYSNQA